ncbi:MAG: hypothetical protein AB1832_00850 [Pseudomonadota bacterium]
MSTDRHVTSEPEAGNRRPAAQHWHRVAGHPAGIVVLTAEPVRRVAKSASIPVSRHPLRSKHA